MPLVQLLSSCLAGVLLLGQFRLQLGQLLFEGLDLVQVLKLVVRDVTWEILSCRQ